MSWENVCRTIEAFSGRTLPGRIIVGVSTVAICCVLSMGWASQAGASDCASLIASFEEALKKRDIPAAKAVEQKIAVDAMCSKDSVEFSAVAPGSKSAWRKRSRMIRSISRNGKGSWSTPIGPM